MSSAEDRRSNAEQRHQESSKLTKDLDPRSLEHNLSIHRTDWYGPIVNKPKTQRRPKMTRNDVVRCLNLASCTISRPSELWLPERASPCTSARALWHKCSAMPQCFPLPTQVPSMQLLPLSRSPGSRAETRRPTTAAEWLPSDTAQRACDTAHAPGLHQATLLIRVPLCILL